MESGRGHRDRNNPEYKLGERNLDVKNDMEFIDMLIKDQRLEVEPGVRGVVLDIAYTLARDQLVEAVRFAKLSNRTNLTVDDLKMVHLEKTDELKSRVKTLRNVDISQEVLPKPCMEKGLMLPNWRNCQVGVMPELYVPQQKPPPRVVQAGPSIVRRLPKGQSIVQVAALGRTGVPLINVIPSTSKAHITKVAAPLKASSDGSSLPKGQSIVPVTALGRTGVPRINVIPSTSNAHITKVAAPPKASSDGSSLPQGQSIVPVAALGRTGVPPINVIPSTSKAHITKVAAPLKASSDGSSLPKGQSIVPVTALGRTGVPRINVIPSTSNAHITKVAAPSKASSDGSRPSSGSPPTTKKPRPN